jgi:hypothetical protein
MSRQGLISAVVLMAALSGALIYARAGAQAGQTSETRTAGADTGTVVLELFTSQGCSSCPPADRLLGELGAEQSGGQVIPLAYHVDYWDHLGWRDPYSSAAWSARQSDYATAMRTAQVYTPQLVVNGSTQLVGSDERSARKIIERELSSASRAVVVLDRLEREGAAIVVEAHVQASSLPAGRKARLIAALFESGLTTSVARGENSGRKLINDYVVRWENPAFAVSNQKQSHGSVRIPVDPAWSGELGVALFVQDTSSPAIYGGTYRKVPR